VRFNLALAARSLGLLPDERLPGICADAIKDGLASDSLAVLACESKGTYDPFRFEDLFQAALRELGMTPPDLLDAARTLVEHDVGLVAAGKVEPREGVRGILEVYYRISGEIPCTEHVGDQLGIERLVGLFHAHDDIGVEDAAGHADIDRAIVAECRRLQETYPG